MKNNDLKEYIAEINKVRMPPSKNDILDYMGRLTGEKQKQLLSFVLSQSHIFDTMNLVFETYFKKIFYEEMGYADKSAMGNTVPKVGADGKLYYEEWLSSDEIVDKSKAVLSSLQGADKTNWRKFSEYIKKIYEPRKMRIYNNPTYSELNSEMGLDFLKLAKEIVQSESVEKELEELKSMPVTQEKGILGKFKSFFAERKRASQTKEIEKRIVSKEKVKEKAFKLIDKYKANSDVMNITKNQMELAEELLKAELSKDEILSVLDGLRNINQESAFVNHKIDEMLKQLFNNFMLAKDLYKPENLYATTFQDMIKNIRGLMIKYDLKEEYPLTTEYREKPLKNQLNAREDVSSLLKGKNLSKEQIEERMSEYDKEFEEVIQEKDPEKYVRKCTSLMMKFVSTHPFDDGNGRTARMLLQVMLGRRGILLPSNIDNYFERQNGTWYSDMESRCLRTENYTQMEDYILERAKRFNNGELVLDDEPIDFDAITERKDEHKKKQSLER